MCAARVEPAPPPASRRRCCVRVRVVSDSLGSNDSEPALVSYISRSLPLPVWYCDSERVVVISDLMSQFRVFQSSHCWPHASRLRCCGAVVAAILALRSSSGFVFLHSFMLCSSSHWERWLSARRRRYVAAATPLYRSSPQLASAFKASCRPNGRRRCFYDFHVVAAPRCSRESVLDSDLSASAT